MIAEFIETPPNSGRFSSRGSSRGRLRTLETPPHSGRFSSRGSSRGRIRTPNVVSGEIKYYHQVNLIKRALLLPITISKQPCKFNVHVENMAGEGPVCIIQVEDSFMKEFILIRKTADIVVLLKKLTKDCAVPELVIRDFRHKYPSVTIEQWGKILEFTTHPNDRRKRKLSLVHVDSFKVPLVQTRKPSTKTPSNMNQILETSEKYKEEFEDVYEEIVDTPSAGKLFVRKCKVNNIDHLLLIKTKDDGGVQIVAEDDRSFEHTVTSTVIEILKKYKTCFPDRDDADSVSIPEAVEDLLVLEQQANDRRRYKMFLRSTPPFVRKAHRVARSPPRLDKTRRGKGNTITAVKVVPSSHTVQDDENKTEKYEDQAGGKREEQGGVHADNSNTNSAYDSALARYNMSSKYKKSVIELDAAAVNVQKNARRYRERHLLEWKKSKFHYGTEKDFQHYQDVCALNIQRVFRGHLARMRVLRLQFLAKMVNTIKRHTKVDGVWTPGLSIQMMLKAVSIVKSKDELVAQYAKSVECLDDSATAIQKQVRRYRTRHSQTWRRKNLEIREMFRQIKLEPKLAIEAMNYAAKVIQGRIRIYFARLRMKNIMKNIVRELATNMEASSTMIQRYARGFIARQRVQRFKIYMRRLVSLEAKAELQYKSKTLYHVFPNLEEQRPWTPGATSWILPLAEAAALKIQCCYRRYAAEVRVANIKHMIKSGGQPSDNPISSDRKFSPARQQSANLSWDFLWDFEVSVEHSFADTFEAASVIQRAMRRSMALRALHWRKMLRKAKIKKYWAKEFLEKPNYSEAVTQGEKIFECLCHPYNGQKWITKQSILQRMQSALEDDERYESLRKSILKCSLLVAPLIGLLYPKRYQSTFSLIDLPKTGFISKELFVNYVSMGQYSEQTNEEMYFNRPITPSRLELLPADRSWMVTPSSHRKISFRLTNNGISKIQPNALSPGALFLARKRLRESSVGYQRLYFAQQRRRWIQKSHLLPADRVEGRRSARKKLLPEDVCSNKDPEIIIQRKVIKAIVRATLLPAGSVIDVSAQKLERLIQRLHHMIKLLPCDDIFGSELDTSSVRTSGLSSFDKEREKVVIVSEIESTLNFSVGRAIESSPQSLTVSTVQKNEEKGSAGNKTKRKRYKKRRTTVSPPQSMRVDEKRKRLAEFNQKMKIKNMKRGKKRQKAVDKEKGVQSMKEKLNSLNKNVSSLEKEIVRRRRKKKRGKRGNMVGNKKEMREIYEAEMAQNVQSIFEWTQTSHQHPSTLEFDGLHSDLDDDPNQTFSDEDEPLILTNGRQSPVPTGKRKGRLIAGAVQTIHRTGETLRSLVAKLETESLQYELNKWERSLERRERLRTPKTKQKVTYDPEVVLKSPIKLSPIVRLEERTKQGTQEQWRVQTPQPIFNESLLEAKQRKKKQEREYASMITKVRKSRRLHLYQSAYLENGKQHNSPRGSASEAVRSLRNFNSSIRETGHESILPAVDRKGKVKNNSIDDLYKRAWLLSKS